MGIVPVFQQAPLHRFAQYLEVCFAAYRLRLAIAPFGILVALESTDRPHSCGSVSYTHLTLPTKA